MELIEYFNSNKDNKFLVSKEEIHSKMNKLFTISVFKNLKNLIEEVVINDEILFGLEETSSGILFFEKYFIICGGNSGLKKFDYRLFDEITLRPKTFTKKGCYLLNGEQLFGLGTTKDDFINSFNDLKKIISKMEFDTSNHKHRFTQHRSTNLTGLGGIKNMFERFGEKEMNHWEIEEIQKEFNLEIVDLNQLTVLISDGEKEIVKKEKGHEYLQKFIRLKKYVSQIRENLLNDLVIGKEDTWLIKSNLLRHLEKLEGENEQLNLLNNISTYLISNFINDKLVDFYEIYEQLDQVGIFNSNYENRIIEELGSINNSLRKMNNKLTYLNVMTTYNTFQLRSIKKKLK